MAEIAKSLVFRTASGRSVLVIASGGHRVDEKKIAALVGEPFHFSQITRDGIGEITKALWRDDGIGQP